MKSILLMLIISFTASSCQCGKGAKSTVTEENTAKNQEMKKDRLLYFGSGGGFTGMTDTYIITEEGWLLREKIPDAPPGEQEQLRKIGEDMARDFIERAEQAGIHETDFNHPGNIYYFIRLKEGDNISSITWGAMDNKAPEAFLELYRDLVNNISETE